MARQSQPGTGAQTEEATAAAGPGPICEIGLCPICAAVIAVGELQPELVEHVVSAGREVLLAVRALIDVRLQHDGPPAKLQRLRIK